MLKTFRTIRLLLILVWPWRPRGHGVTLRRPTKVGTWKIYSLIGTIAAVFWFVGIGPIIAGVVGVGNIYANEALFRSGIDPRRAAGKIGRGRYHLLGDQIKDVLAEAIEQGGTTLRDFFGADGKPGYFRIRLKIYGRADEPCQKCNTTIRSVRIGQRNTFYCPRCQH